MKTPNFSQVTFFRSEWRFSKLYLFLVLAFWVLISFHNAQAARSTSTKFVYNSSMIQPVDIHLPPDQFDSSLVALLRVPYKWPLLLPNWFKQMMCRDPLRRPTAIDLIQLSSLHDSYSSNPTPVVSNAVLQLELSCAKARIAALEAALIDPMKVEAPPTKYPIV